MAAVVKNRSVRRAGAWIFRKVRLDVEQYYAVRRLMAARKWLRSRGVRAGVKERDGFLVFHDRGNTLVRKGPLYEPTAREALFALCVIDSLRGGPQQIADVGANIGLHTAFLARRFPSAEIHAYDPSPQSVRYLRETIEYNKLTARVHLHECALGSAEGEVQLFTWGSESSADSLRDTRRVLNRAAVKVSVPLQTLDREYEEGVRPTVIKMDCEGGELDVLRGATKMFRTLRPVVFTEFAAANIGAFGLRARDLLKWAGDNDYRVLTESFAALESESALENAHAAGQSNFILLPAELYGSMPRAREGPAHNTCATI